MASWNSNGFTVRPVTALTDAVLLTDDIILYTGAGAKAVSIPAASSSSLMTGKVYHFANSNTGAVTITPASGQIDGGATKSIAAGGTAISTLTLCSDGTQWRTIEYTVGS